MIAERINANNQDYGPLRKHQKAALDLASAVVHGVVNDRILTAGVTPGGGKTLMASLLCNRLLDAGMAEQVLVIVPNRPLVHQMRASFHAPERGLVRYLSEETGQRTIPGLGRPSGRVMTYQACSMDPKSALRFVQRRKTIVVLDEVHHLATDRAWHAAIAPLAAAGVLVLAMSGTLSRGDGERIPLVAYDEGKPRVHIRYSRREALDEHAILPLVVKRFDGRSFYEYRGKDVMSEISAAPVREQARTLKTALLDHDWVETLVMEAMRDWDHYRRSVYSSKAIIVCHSQDRAKKTMRLVAHNFPDARPVLAICDEPEADQRIKAFRSGSANVLVTVKKAYEGLDVADATHLIYLGDARTVEFLDQVFARVTRVNHRCGLSWEEQEARIFVPDDAKTREYLDKLFEEQACMSREPQVDHASGAMRAHSTFRPDHAEHTRVGVTINESALDGRVLELVRDLEREEPMTRALPLRAKLKIVNHYRRGEQNA